MTEDVRLAALPGHPLLRIGRLMDEDEAGALFDELLAATPWTDGSFSVAGRSFKLPRVQAWYSDPGVIYQYADKIHNSHAWTDTLQRVRERVSAASGHLFNGVLLNLYRDGDDAVGWHADDEPNLGPSIASLSLGATRNFSIRQRPAGAAFDVPLAAGTLLVMDPPFQQQWQHAVPADPAVREPRLNLTFRRIIANGE